MVPASTEIIGGHNLVLVKKSQRLCCPIWSTLDTWEYLNLNKTKNSASYTVVTIQVLTGYGWQILFWTTQIIEWFQHHGKFYCQYQSEGKSAEQS